ELREQIANIEADAARDVARIQADSAREVANIRAAVDREAIAAQERIATADRESRERIARLEEEGRNRRFDLELAEERRQFNANMLVSLLQTGVELSRRPVDWIAHQYYMQNLNIPLTTMNFGAMASLLGAVPPSGPSEAGPVVGGPAVLDGDLQFAQAAGVQNPGLVSVQEAVQANPGQGREVAPLTAANTLPQLAEQAGGLDQLERMVAQARVTVLPGAVQDSDLMRRELQRQQEVLAR